MLEADAVRGPEFLGRDLVDRPRRGDGVVAGHQVEGGRGGVEPEAGHVVLAPHDDAAGHPLHHDHHVVVAGLGARLLTVVDRAEDDDLGAVEARCHRDVARRHVRLHRLLAPGCCSRLTSSICMCGASLATGGGGSPPCAALGLRLSCGERQQPMPSVATRPTFARLRMTHGASGPPPPDIRSAPGGPRADGPAPAPPSSRMFADIAATGEIEARTSTTLSDRPSSPMPRERRGTRGACATTSGSDPDPRLCVRTRPDPTPRCPRRSEAGRPAPPETCPNAGIVPPAANFPLG